jgi:hypothetical protein
MTEGAIEEGVSEVATDVFVASGRQRGRKDCENVEIAEIWMIGTKDCQAQDPGGKSRR